MPKMQCIHRVMVSNTCRELLGGEFGMSNEAFRVYSMGKKRVKRGLQR